MFLKNKNIIFKIRKSKVTDYAALTTPYRLVSALAGLIDQECNDNDWHTISLNNIPRSLVPFCNFISAKQLCHTLLYTCIDITFEHSHFTLTLLLGDLKEG